MDRGGRGHVCAKTHADPVISTASLDRDRLLIPTSQRAGRLLGYLPERGRRMSLAATDRREMPHDVGTLWTLRRSGHTARCALMALVGEWEPRIIVDGHTVLAERCPRGDEAFAVADAWKRRMLDEGWQQVVPAAAPEPVVVNEACVETRTSPFLATRFV
jgi:hypothetical protein